MVPLHTIDFQKITHTEPVKLCVRL